MRGCKIDDVNRLETSRNVQRIALVKHMRRMVGNIIVSDGSVELGNRFIHNAGPSDDHCTRNILLGGAIALASQLGPRAAQPSFCAC